MKVIHVDHPVVEAEELNNRAIEATTPESYPTPQPALNGTPKRAEDFLGVGEYSSPAFVKRARTSFGSLWGDDFSLDDGTVKGKGRKRTRLSSTWIVTSRTPTPEVDESETVAESSNTAQLATAPTVMMDEGIQTENFEDGAPEALLQFARQSIVSPALDNVALQTSMTTATDATSQSNLTDLQMQQRHQSDEKVDNNIEHTSQVIATDIENTRASEDHYRQPTSPKLQPLPSDNLLLVSPILSGSIGLSSEAGKATATDPSPNNNRIPESLEVEVEVEEDIYGASLIRHTIEPRRPAFAGSGGSSRTLEASTMSEIQGNDLHLPEQYNGWQSINVPAPPHINFPDSNSFEGQMEDRADQNQYHQEHHHEQLPIPHFEPTQHYPDLDDVLPLQHPSPWGFRSIPVQYPELSDHGDNLDGLVRSLAQAQGQPRSRSRREQSTHVDLTESDGENQSDGDDIESDNPSGSSQSQRSTRGERDIQEELSDEDGGYEDEGEAEFSAASVQRAFVNVQPVQKSRSQTEKSEEEDYEDDGDEMEQSTPADDDEGDYDDEDRRVDPHGNPYPPDYYPEEEQSSSEGEEDEEEDYLEDDPGDVQPARPSQPQVPQVIDLISSDEEDNDEPDSVPQPAVTLTDPHNFASTALESESDEENDIVEDDGSEEEEDEEDDEKEEEQDASDSTEEASSAKDNDLMADDNLEFSRGVHVSSEGKSPDDSHYRAGEDTDMLNESLPEPITIAAGSKDQEQAAKSDQSFELDESEAKVDNAIPNPVFPFISQQQQSRITQDETSHSGLVGTTEQSKGLLELSRTSPEASIFSNIAQISRSMASKSSPPRPSQFSKVFSIDGANDEPEEQSSNPALPFLIPPTAATHIQDKVKQSALASAATLAQLPTPDATQITPEIISQHGPSASADNATPPEIDLAQHNNNDSASFKEAQPQIPVIVTGNLTQSTTIAAGVESVSDSKIATHQDAMVEAIRDAELKKAETGGDVPSRGSEKRSVTPEFQVARPEGFTADSPRRSHRRTRSTSKVLDQITADVTSSSKEPAQTPTVPKTAVKLKLKQASPQPLITKASLRSSSPRHVFEESNDINLAQQKSDPPTSPKSAKGKASLSATSSRQPPIHKEGPQLAQPPVTPTKHILRSMDRDTRQQHSPSVILDKLATQKGHDASIELALSSLNSPDHDLRRTPILDLKLRLNRNLRTELADFKSLKILRYELNKKLDVLAIATSIPSAPERAKNGPRHYSITFHVTDPSIAPAGATEVQILRPYKEALPAVDVGDGILLRNFAVVSLKNRGFGLRSDSESSSWVVFKAKNEVQVKGPPVEYGEAESNHVTQMKVWYENLDESSLAKLRRVSGDKG